MKALSIKQPWASLIAHGIKDIENRTWRTNFRGKIYIHVSSPKNFEVQLSDEQTKLALPILQTAFDGNMPFGAIIGEVEIIDCIVNHPSIWAERTPIKGKTVEGDILYEGKPIWNWVLANAKLYEKPILNVKGKLSFWEPEICLQICESCEEPTDIETMKIDDDSNWFCPTCWEVLLPIMIQEAEELKEEESICETCTAGMCEICSERHTSQKYQLNKEMAGEHYASQIEEITETKVYEHPKMQRGDIIDYQYACGSSSDVVKAEVTWIDSQGYYVKYKHPVKGVVEEKAKIW